MATTSAVPLHRWLFPTFQKIVGLVPHTASCAYFVRWIGNALSRHCNLYQVLFVSSHSHHKDLCLSDIPGVVVCTELSIHYQPLSYFAMGPHTASPLYNSTNVASVRMATLFHPLQISWVAICYNAVPNASIPSAPSKPEITLFSVNECLIPTVFTAPAGVVNEAMCLHSSP